MKDNWQEYRTLYRASRGQGIKPVPLGRFWRRPGSEALALGPLSTVLAPGLPCFISAAITGGGLLLSSALGLEWSTGLGMPGFDAFLSSLTDMGIVVGGIGSLAYVIVRMDL